MTMLLRHVFLLSLCAILMGCSSTKSPPLVTPVDEAHDPASAQLAETASAVSYSLNDLAAIQQAASPPLKFNAAQDPSTYNMPGVVSIDWSGPVEPLLRKLAQVDDFRLRVVGVRPAIPVIVTINARQQPLSDVVRNIAFQTGRHADIHVYGPMKVIELRYLPVGR